MSNGSAAKRNTLTTPEWIVMSALWGREPQVLGEIIETIGDRVDWSYTTYAEELMRCMIKRTGLSKEGQERMKALIEALSEEGGAAE